MMRIEARRLPIVLVVIESRTAVDLLVGCDQKYEWIGS